MRSAPRHVQTKEVFDSLFPGTGVVVPSTDDGKPTPMRRPWLEGADPKQVQARLLRAALTLFIFLVAAAIADGLAIWSAEYVGQHLLYELRKALFEHLQTLSMAFYDRQRLGELISRVSNDTNVLQRNLGANLAWIVSSPVTVAYGVYLMLRFSAILTLGLVFILPLVIALTVVLGRRIRTLSRRTQERLGDLTTALHEALAGVRIINIQDRQRHGQTLTRRTAP